MIAEQLYCHLGYVIVKIKVRTRLLLAITVVVHLLDAVSWQLLDSFYRKKSPAEISEKYYDLNVQVSEFQGGVAVTHCCRAGEFSTNNQ